MNIIKTRDFYFDTLKGFLIIVVIIGNTIEFAAPTKVNTHFFILFLYMFHMPLFTFISGYFSKKSKRTTVEKVKHTFKLYVLAQIIYVAYSNFIQNNNYELTLLSTHWTFWYLLTLTCLYIIQDYIKNKKLWLIFSIMFSLLIGFDSSVATIGSFSRTFFFLPFFIAGLMFEKKHVEFLKLKRISLGVLSIIILVILYIFNEQIPIELLFEYTNYESSIHLGFLPLYVRIFHFIGAFTIGAFILSIVPNKHYYISEIGKNSLHMYLVHAITIHTVYPYLRFNNILQIILSGICIILCCIFVSKALMYAINFYETSNIKLKIDNISNKDKKISV
ncbi:MAG: acyltransferase family protein [Clostridium sp.]|uniref:acyltransferase family protein n=1 Tax=Clostridium sp. TaxID=1506 RepID=UPI003EE4D2CA